MKTNAGSFQKSSKFSEWRIFDILATIETKDGQNAAFDGQSLEEVDGEADPRLDLIDSQVELEEKMKVNDRENTNKKFSECGSWTQASLKSRG